MSDAKHTPGPLDFVAVGANASGGFHIYMVDATMRKIAALWGKAEEKEANAVLWRAAPDLLDALRDLVEDDTTPEANCACHLAPPCNDCVEHGARRELIANARSAIAKATGAA